MQNSNKYFTGIDQTLEQYVPLPLDALYKGAAAIQQRGDAAMQQQDAVQTGLDSIEALAPAHKDYIRKFTSNVRSEYGNLLDKFGGNSSNPEFIRESRKLGMQFAGDPGLKVIQQSNNQYKSKEALRDQLDSKGIKYIDSNPNFIGVDKNGNLSADVGQLKEVHFDKIIEDRIKQAASKKEQRGNLRSNQWNIEGTNQALKTQLLVDPDLASGVQYFMQKGLSQENAIKNMSSYIDTVSNSMIDSDVDHHYEDFIQRERFHQDDKIAKQPPLPKVVNLLDDKTPIEEQTNPFKSNISQIDKILSNLNVNGGLKKGTFEVQDTPENRKKYPNGNITGNKAVPGAPNYIPIPGTSKIIVQSNNYNPEEYKKLTEYREILGPAAKNSKGEWLADKTIFNKVKEAYATSAKEFKPQITYDKKLNDVVQDIFVGNNGEKADQIYTIKNGGLTQVDRSNLKNFRYQGITTSPTDLLPDGFMKVTAEDKKSGEIKTFAMPIPEDIKNKTTTSSTIYNYLTTGKIDYSKVSYTKGSDGKPLDGYFTDPNTGYIYKPYKKYENNKFSVGAVIYNNNGKKLGSAPLSNIEKEDLKNLYQFIGSNNE